MKTFLIADGDIVINSDQKIEMVDGDAEVAQALERCFTTNTGEWFLNAGHGLEYPKIRGKGVSDEAIQMAVIKAAVQDKRVKEVISIDIERNEPGRAVRILLHCKLDSGVTTAVPFSFY